MISYICVYIYIYIYTYIQQYSIRLESSHVHPIFHFRSFPATAPLGLEQILTDQSDDFVGLFKSIPILGTTLAFLRFWISRYPSWPSWQTKTLAWPVGFWSYGRYIELVNWVYRYVCM